MCPLRNSSKFSSFLVDRDGSSIFRDLKIFQFGIDKLLVQIEYFQASSFRIPIVLLILNVALPAWGMMPNWSSHWHKNLHFFQHTLGIVTVNESAFSSLSLIYNYHEYIDYTLTHYLQNIIIVRYNSIIKVGESFSGISIQKFGFPAPPKRDYVRSSLAYNSKVWFRQVLSSVHQYIVKVSVNIREILIGLLWLSFR